MIKKIYKFNKKRKFYKKKIFYKHKYFYRKKKKVLKNKIFFQLQKNITLLRKKNARRKRVLFKILNGNRLINIINSKGKISNSSKGAIEK